MNIREQCGGPTLGYVWVRWHTGVRTIHSTTRSALAGLVATFLVLGLGGQATADGTFIVLYDVDFDSPTHTLDSAPTLGNAPAPRATPTAIRRSPVTVVSAYGGLTAQPMAFPGPRGDVAFALSDLPPCPDYRLAMDVVVDNDLRLILSTPVANVVHFQSNGNVVVRLTAQTSATVATYTPGDGAVMALEVRVNLAAGSFELLIDGTSVHTATFGGQTALTEFRLLGDRAAVDDIVVDSGEEPVEPVEIEARVDVRPRCKGPALFTLRRRGALPVALLSTERLDASSVDVATLRLADAEGSDGVPPKRARLKDVNRDGVADLMMYFRNRDLVRAGVLSSSTTSVELTALTLEGVPVRGADDVKYVRCWFERLWRWLHARKRR